MAVNAKTELEEIWNSNLGISLELQNDFLGSLAARLRAVALKPNDPVNHYNLAFSYDSLCYFDAAKCHYARAIDLEEGFTQAHHSLATVCKKVGERDAAYKWYMRALEL
jgi:tetratricopeptide (TPR) repeat protein